MHYNSAIPNHAFYLLAYRIGGRSWQKAGAIWMRTLLKLKAEPKAELTMREWAIRTIQAATELRRSDPWGLNRRVIPHTYAAWDSVGIKIRPAEVRRA
ncbi:MAG: hypothetical protein D6772_14415 [Bacteroidetes bacterium]|nr:MAG: hypothetical protein D6772_14415 [Bacteroidota bacterium]